MIYRLTVGLLAAALVSLPGPARAESDKQTWTFDTDKVGASPPGFAFARTGEGKLGTWVIQKQSGAPSGDRVLAQTDTDATDHRFPIAVAEQPVAADVRVSVRCKAVSGKVDQACGLVWRYQDADNYYIARANALEGNVRLYTVSRGKRKQLASWTGQIASGRWHELAIESVGSSQKVFWNGKEVLSFTDKLFAKAGRIGLWTKADSVTLFDDLSVELVKPARTGGLDPARIEKLTGAKGALAESEGVFKVSVPRSDLAVTVGGTVKMTPPLGLTSWAAFQHTGDHTMVMGDMVLTEDQVSPVMTAALEVGLEVTALHNHFLWDSPKVMFMHVGGMGGEAELARAIGRVFAEIKKTTNRPPRAHPAIEPAASSLSAAKLDAILGVKGDYKDGVYKIVIGRTTKMAGHEVGKTMGVNTWAAFAGSDKLAIVDGDFAVLESELQPVLKSLRRAGIHVVAIHNHMTGDDPRMIFLHYWGQGPAATLARSLQRTLKLTRHR